MVHCVDSDQCTGSHTSGLSATNGVKAGLVPLWYLCQNTLPVLVVWVEGLIGIEECLDMRIKG